MDFKYENEMLEPVHNWLLSNDYLVKNEFVTSWGICDLVGVKFNKNHVKKRIKLGQQNPIGPKHRVFLLENIPDTNDGKSITIKRLKTLLDSRVDEINIEKEINYLLKNNFIISNKMNHFQSINGWKPLHKKIVAIELKLNRIEEAFHQAYNNLVFATDSYVAFPNDVAKRLVNSIRINKFKKTGIGIIGVEKYNCEVLVKCKQSQNINTTIQAHIVERFWRS